MHLRFEYDQIGGKMKELLLLWLMICLSLPVMNANAEQVGKIVATATTSSGSTLDIAFQSTWGAFWFKSIPSTAVYKPFKVNRDTVPGLHALYFRLDRNYRVPLTNVLPVVNIYRPGSWNDRDSGRVLLGKTHLPNDFVLPDATRIDTPNNPAILYNFNTHATLLLNAATRPVRGGALWAYISSPKPCTHAGSGLTGGYVTLTELNNGSISHALGINVWGRKYLSQYGGGFVFPADRADTGYKDPNSINYYGGNLPALRMGSHLAIPRTITQAQLGISSKEGVALFKAMQAYGVYIVDNSAWDALYLQSTSDAQSILMQRQVEIFKLFSALQIVQ